MEDQIKELSEWYVQHVFDKMRHRGYSEEEIPYVIGKTRFWEALEKYPEQQLYYAAEIAIGDFFYESSSVI